MRGSVGLECGAQRAGAVAGERRDRNDAPAAAAGSRRGPADARPERRAAPPAGACARAVGASASAERVASDAEHARATLQACRDVVSPRRSRARAQPRRARASILIMTPVSHTLDSPRRSVATKGVSCSNRLAVDAFDAQAADDRAALGRRAPRRRAARRVSRAACRRISRRRTPCQDAAIELWPDEVAGWKVGLIAPRPGRRPSSRTGSPGRSSAAACAGRRRAAACASRCSRGGFAAVEAEFLLLPRSRRAAPSKLEWTRAEARELVAAVHVGVETAGSPLATINDLGPARDRRGLRQQRGPDRRPRASGLAHDARRGMALRVVRRRRERRPRPRRRRAGRAIRVAALPARAQRAALAAAESRRLGVDGRDHGRARDRSRAERAHLSFAASARSSARPEPFAARSARRADGESAMLTRRALRRGRRGVRGRRQQRACGRAERRARRPRTSTRPDYPTVAAVALDRRAAAERVRRRAVAAQSITRASSAARRTRSSSRESARSPSRACTAPCSTT